MLGIFSSKANILECGLLEGGVDTHSHILYGVDDGMSSQKESLAALAYLEELGLKELWLTPHTMEDVPNTSEMLNFRFEELKDAYSGSIELHLASEYMMDNLFMEHLSKHDLLTHREEDDVLIETSTWSAPYSFWDNIKAIMKEGYRPVLAHPERYEYMNKNDYRKLVQMGVKLQLNYPSLTGFYGKHVADKANLILENGWYSMAGSDCHRLRVLTHQLEANELKKKTADDLQKLIQL